MRDILADLMEFDKLQRMLLFISLEVGLHKTKGL